jgi:hypothetical protein
MFGAEGEVVFYPGGANIDYDAMLSYPFIMCWWHEQGGIMEMDMRGKGKLAAMATSGPGEQIW